MESTSTSEHPNYFNDEQQESPEYAALRRNPEYVAMNARLVERIPEQARDIVDIGCGDGAVSETLLDARPGSSLVGVDPSPALLAAAEARLGSRGRFLLGDASSVAALLSPCSCDVAVFANCIHLVEDLPDALEAVRRVLRPRGSVVINSAFYAGAESPEDLALYTDLIAAARRKAKSEGLVLERRPVGRPLSLRRKTSEYVSALEQAGFADITCEEVPFTLGRPFLTALCSTPMFASVALAGVERERAAQLMVEALETVPDPVHVTRRCAYLTARCP